MGQNLFRQPKKSIQKRRLNVVWFVDSTKTHAFSVSERLLWILGLVAIAVLMAALATVFQVSRQAKLIAHKDAYIKELKASIIALSFGVSQEEPAVVAAPESAENPRGDDEPAPAPTPTAAPQAPLPELAKSSVSSSSRNVAMEAFSFQVMLESKKNIAEVTFKNLRPGSTISGFACAVFLLNDGTRMLAPAEAKQDSDGRCTSGVAMKFARVRPTQFEVAVLPDRLKNVEIQFSSANKTVFVKQVFDLTK